MTNEEFCKLDTEFYGKEVDHVEQIVLRSFNGYELKEYVEHCIKLYSLNSLNIVERREQLLCRCCGGKKNDNGVCINGNCSVHPL